MTAVPQGRAAAQAAAGDIHLWHVDLRAAFPAGLEGCLSAQERERAGRFRFAADRQAYSLCRAALRQILSEHLVIEPAEVRFRLGPHGKPELAADFAGTVLRFNVSHCADMALIAVSSASEVGVDIERIRYVAEAEDIAHIYFSPSERDFLAGLPASHRPEAFMTIWTRKEAYCKARGGGILIPLDRFCVVSKAGRIVVCPDREIDAPLWTVMGLRFGDAATGGMYIGALAAPGAGWRTHIRKWRPMDWRAGAAPAVRKDRNTVEHDQWSTEIAHGYDGERPLRGDTHAQRGLPAGVRRHGSWDEPPFDPGPAAPSARNCRKGRAEL